MFSRSEEGKFHIDCYFFATDMGAAAPGKYMLLPMRGLIPSCHRGTLNLHPIPFSRVLLLLELVCFPCGLWVFVASPFHLHGLKLWKQMQPFAFVSLFPGEQSVGILLEIALSS